MAEPNRLEHFLFYNYHKAVKAFLKNSLYLSKYTPNLNVSVYYTTPPVAFAKFVVPLINGSNMNPTVSFNLSSSPRAQGQTPGGYTDTYLKTDDPYTFEKIKHPLVYELTYRVTIWTTRQSDMDILLYQAQTAAPFNRKYATVVDGQWCNIEVMEPQRESSLDPGEAQDVSFRYGFDIRIPRAYLPLSYEQHKGRVDEYDIIYDITKEVDENV
ncbi:MAG: hypothetical protein ACOC1O_00405 [bacterium]